MSQGKGGRRNRAHHYNKHKVNLGDQGKEVLESIDENNPVVKQFQAYGQELDDKHDRMERIVKLSRDITIESKRIIFLLHTIDKESNQEPVLSKAKLRLDNVIDSLFKNIAYELDHRDTYQYLRAYRAGLQEYVEALTFYQYLKDNELQDWTVLQKILTYSVLDKSQACVENDLSPNKTIQTLIPPNEFILGIADLTGELMRKCINNLATGDIASCYQTCNFVRSVYTGFLGCASASIKGINIKLYTLKQSLAKMENVCYTIKIRGSEIPKHMLADVAIIATEEYPADDDEGFHAL